MSTKYKAVVIGCILLMVLIAIVLLNRDFGHAEKNPLASQKAKQRESLEVHAQSTQKVAAAPALTGSRKVFEIPPPPRPGPGSGGYRFTPGRKTREEILALESEQLIKSGEAADQRYEPIYNELGLNGEQRNQLLVLKIKEAKALEGLLREAIMKTVKNIEKRPAAVEAAKMRAQSDYFYELRETLGESIAGEIAAFDRAIPVSYIVDRITEQMTAQNALDPKQLRALREIVVKNSTDSFGRASPAFLSPTALHADAKSVLSDEQYKILNNLVDTGVITAPISNLDYEWYIKKTKIK